MWGFIKGLFSAPAIVQQGLGMVDKAFFTDQEKQDWLLKWYQATAPMNVARRIIASVITLLWALGVIVCGILLFWNHPLFVEMMGFMRDTVNGPFEIIMGFYFLAHVTRTLKDGSSP